MAAIGSFALGAIAVVVSMAVAAGRRTILQVYVPHYTSLSIASINASSIDVIAYAFATVTSGGLCALSNAEDAANLAALLQLKKRFPRLRTTLSVGGGDVAMPFKTAAATNASRATFAQSCAALAARYSFDGLDVDWEVPVQSDATTYPLLMAALRAALPPGSLLTTASSTQNALQFQMAAAIAPVVDWINIMGYDYTGSWEAKPITKHNAPLFPSGAQPNAVGTAVLSYLAAGVPAGQLVLGVPFYGFQRTGVASSTPPTLAGAQGLFVSAAASPSYYLAAPDIQDLLAADSNWAPYWDATACAAYAFNPVQASFITYESARSLATKAQYVGAHGLLGMMAWELSQDDSSSTLLNAMAAGLRAVSLATTSRSRTPRPTTSRSRTPRPTTSRHPRATSSRLNRRPTTMPGRSSTRLVERPSTRSRTKRPTTRRPRTSSRQARSPIGKSSRSTAKAASGHDTRPGTSSKRSTRRTTVPSRPTTNPAVPTASNRRSTRASTTRSAIRSSSSSWAARRHPTRRPLTLSPSAAMLRRRATSPAAPVMALSSSPWTSWAGSMSTARGASCAAVVLVTVVAAGVVWVRSVRQRILKRQQMAHTRDWLSEPAI